MKLRLLTAGGNADWETTLVQACQQPGSPAEVVQRCYDDLGELLAAADAGKAQVAVVAATQRWLDREAVRRLTDAKVSVVGVIAAGDEEAERRLRQLGVTHMGFTSDGPGVLVDRARAAVLTQPAADGEPAAQDDAPADQDASAGGPRVVVAVWGPKGAPGRTTTALNVAFEAAPLVGETLLVDADTYGGTVDQKLGFQDDNPGLAWAARLASRGELDTLRLWRETRRATAGGPRVLVGLSRAPQWIEVRPVTWEALLDLFRAAFPLTVLDLAFCLEEDEELTYDQVHLRRNAITRLSLEHADLVVAVARGDADGLREFIRSYQELREFVPPERIRVVINQVRRSVFAGDPVSQIANALVRFLDVEPVAYVHYDRASLDAALMVGQALREARPGSPAQGAFADLTVRLLEATGLRASDAAPTSRTRRPRGRWRRRAALEEG